jgi:GT2 family glycosyltransferase
MENNPLVTINILSFNRRDYLKITLGKVFEQSYKNIEVIVVDNASTDATVEMVKSEFPLVRFIQLKKNIGIAGWNEGFKNAKGEYVLVLDDDSYPEDNTICEGLKKFNNNIGIIAFNIFNTRINRSETEDFLAKPSHFIGCGALIKKSVIDKVGYFNEDYFIYYHELDYSARCYNKGFQILYVPEIRVIHNQSMLSRGDIDEDPFLSSYRFYHHFISYGIFLIQNFSPRYSVIYLLKWIINRTVVCINHNFYHEYFKAIFNLITRLPEILQNRNVLNYSVQEFYRFGNVPFIEKEIIRNK